MAILRKKFGTDPEYYYRDRGEDVATMQFKHKTGEKTVTTYSKYKGWTISKNRYYVNGKIKRVRIAMFRPNRNRPVNQVVDNLPAAKRYIDLQIKVAKSRLKKRV